MELDEKRGLRRPSSFETWRLNLVSQMDSGLSVFGPHLNEVTSAYCRACLRLLRKENDLAFEDCMALIRFTPLHDFLGEIVDLPIPTQIQKRLIALCILGTLRVHLWPNHVTYAIPKFQRMLHKWRQHLLDTGSIQGVLIANRCSNYLATRRGLSLADTWPI